MADVDSWEDIEVIPPVVKVVGKADWADEDIDIAKENWDDEDEVPKPTEEAETSEKKAVSSTKQKKSKSGNKKTKDENNEEDLDDGEPLTEAERQKLQMDSDLEAAKATFGITSDTPDDTSLSIEGWNPQSKDDFDALCTTLVSRLNNLKKSPHYKDFLSNLFRDISTSIADSESVRRYGKELSALGAELHKQEKEKEKKPRKGKAKLAVGSTKSDAFNLDDYYAQNDDGVDDEDFM